MMSRDDEETRAEDKDAYFVSYREVKVGKRVKVYLTKGGPDGRCAALPLDTQGTSQIINNRRMPEPSLARVAEEE